MNKYTLLPKLVTFLKKEGCYKAFISNINSKSNGSYSPITYKRICLESPRAAINAGFIWGHTPQGHNFWSLKESRWHKYLREHDFQATNNKTDML